MRTLLYNLNTKRPEGGIREGRYLVDGKPGILPNFIIEVEVEKISAGAYNTATQTIEQRSYIDLENKKWIEETYVRDLTSYEIEQRQPKSPEVWTPRQLRIALIKSGISLTNIESQIDAIEDSAQKEIARVEWEYALEIKKEHPLVSMMATNLNLTEQQVNDIFSLAVTL